MTIQTTEGDLLVKNARFCLVVARFNSFIVESLLDGAVDTLKRHGATDDDLHIVRVPGAVEIPLAVQRVAASGNYDAIIALGAVIGVARRISTTWRVNAQRAWPVFP